MSVLRSTYLEVLPDRDRWGHIDKPDNTLAVHIATTGWEHIHISLEENDGENFIEVNLTIEDALQLLAGLAEAIRGAMPGAKR
ncbi:hypothetical protein UFOVP433_12 [uncultured Caudovirales phage]|uniref:Uncharacterized protein n=1 Tax=uncultured Caudovirales phage TaxID=2100421 RepID=A0A6J5NTG1_9CAUD|nr:hypothetical protein UFOVP433_12 [uncultured Caudovirales phage]CAB4158514.1 hypothetical protein UFOVP702_15 [uncultured Caudovirales phage]